MRRKYIGKGGMYARDFYPMMDYRATANCSTLFLFFPRRKNSDLVRDRRCRDFCFFSFFKCKHTPPLTELSSTL